MDIGQPSAARKLFAPDRGLARRLRLLGLVAALLATSAGAAWFIHRFVTLVFVDDARVAADMITVSSRVPGWVAEVRVIAGDIASRGSLLVRIDSRESEIMLRELEARLASVDARRAELEARLAMVDLQTSSAEAGSRAKLEVARAALPAAEAERVFAEAEYGRAMQLMASGSGTRQRHDQTRSLLDAARQKVLGATAEILNAEAQIAAATAAREELRVLRRQIESLEPQARELAAQRDRAALDLRDRSILMPFDGSIDRVFIDPGEYVAAGQRVLMLHDPTRVRVEANVKETEIRWFRPGTAVRVTVDALPGRRFDGVVERVASAATSEFALLPSPNPSGNFTKITQRLPVRIALRPAPEPGLLRPGMMVQVEASAIE
ncbi:multidrug resistance protein [Siccirubricoccus deserti]|uniref:HlyD family secretion protein n=1 Tax=Siccirubricoccus deserti TaxID=2013562 RepID=A0A9X0UD38_9PROT|nr:HlyD family secretion protein [Siccirubricoccus deserti]MBC4015236.1 HlyD family secretion protein [Siccirubricoccus deserti]GGC37933.1 multidrug resistance protein [Siccirubricoccus deserti]